MQGFLAGAFANITCARSSTGWSNGLRIQRKQFAIHLEKCTLPRKLPRQPRFIGEYGFVPICALFLPISVVSDNRIRPDPSNQDLGLHFTPDELDVLDRVNEEIAAEARAKKEQVVQDAKQN